MIIICPNILKEKYLKSSNIHNYKFFTLDEIKEKVFFKYSDLALYEVSKNFNIKPSIVKKIFENLYYVNNKGTKKLNKLLEIKEFLNNNGLIETDENFYNFLKDEIIIDGYLLDKKLKKIIAKLSKYTKVNINELTKKYDLNEIYEFRNTEEEIRFVAENILDLLKQNIDVNNIFIVNYNVEYLPKISRIFSLFNIPFYIEKSYSLSMFKITKEFLTKIKNSSLTVKESKEILEDLNEKYHDIDKLNMITKILNKYYSLNEPLKNLYEVIKYELKNTYVSSEKYKNAILISKEISIYDDTKYVFAISNNEGVNPIIYKDNDYLSDYEKAILDIDNSLESTILEEKYFLNKLANIKNLYLTYKLHSDDNECSISSCFENIPKKTYEFKNNSSKYNKYLFDNTNTYNNEYTKINFEDLKKYLNNNINLSYSSMDNFFKCQFRFYLNNILKIEPSEETMATKVGSMFHKILERVLKNNYLDYELVIDEEINNYLNNDLKEKFYAQKLKKEVIKLIEILKKREEISDFKNAYFEEFLKINKNLEINVQILGFVDKIMLFNDGINNYVVVIDYKTGTVSTDFTKLKDGFNMQLLIYLYLIKNTSKIDKPILVGAYIEHLLSDVLAREEGKTYSELEAKTHELEGISSKDKNRLFHLDHNYDIKSYIKGIRVKNDGDFYNYSKVYTDKEFDILLDLVDKNINKVIDAILRCDFKINPKRYITAKPNDVVGCEYCPFKEVCYVESKDIQILPETTMEEILGECNEVD